MAKSHIANLHPVIHWPNNKEERTMLKLEEITTLEELLEFLQNEDITNIDMSDLPTFGGDIPQTTECIWSWDNDNIIIGECADDFQIVSRNFLK